MVINNLKIVKIAQMFSEAYTESVIYPYAELSSSISVQLFQMIPWWNHLVIQFLCIVNHYQFSQCNLLNITWKLKRFLLIINLLSFSISKALYHNIPLLRVYVNQVYVAWLT